MGIDKISPDRVGLPIEKNTQWVTYPTYPSSKNKTIDTFNEDLKVSSKISALDLISELIDKHEGTLVTEEFLIEVYSEMIKKRRK